MSGIDPFFDRDGVTIHVGDCRDVLRQLPDCSVNCCVTSPPYWGLRDYNHAGQIGLEQTPEDYIAEMVAVFREVRRVLRDDGTLWLNLGDSYNAGRDGGHPGGKKQWKPEQKKYQGRSGANAPDLKPKDLIGIPWRVAFALQADGWYLRQDIIWHKPNPMPESVRDRCTKAHEYIFLLSKSARYYYDAEAVKEPATCDRMRGPALHPDTVSTNGNSGLARRELTDIRNRRSVWTVTTKPYSGAHFATFPPALIEPCIRAGTSERGCCPKCGKPWERVVEMGEERPLGHAASRKAQEVIRKYRGESSVSCSGMATNTTRERRTTGWRPACECGGDPVPCTVLDPFLGSGTTAEVAQRHGCRCIGIELNPEYAALAEKRFRQRILL